MFVTPLKVIYSSIQISNVLVLTVRCELINFVFQIFPLFIPEKENVTQQFKYHSKSTE
jgi:hypothetical protein